MRYSKHTCIYIYNFYSAVKFAAGTFILISQILLVKSSYFAGELWCEYDFPGCSRLDRTRKSMAPSNWMDALTLKHEDLLELLELCGTTKGNLLRRLSQSCLQNAPVLNCLEAHTAGNKIGRPYHGIWMSEFI